jgi:hypothetical protein
VRFFHFFSLLLRQPSLPSTTTYTRSAPLYTSREADFRRFDRFFINYGVTEHIAESRKQWLIPFAVQIIPGGLFAIGLPFFCRESPRWLISRSRRDEAIKNLCYLRNLDRNDAYLVQEINDIDLQSAFSSAVLPLPVVLLHSAFLFFRLSAFSSMALTFFLPRSRERPHRRRYRLLGTYPPPLLALVPHSPSPHHHQSFHLPEWNRFVSIYFPLFAYCTMLTPSRHTGINAINYYSPTIFRSVGIDGGNTSLLTTGLFGVVKTICSLIWAFLLIGASLSPAASRQMPSLMLLSSFPSPPASFFLLSPLHSATDRYGRRILMIVGSAGCAVSMYIVGGYIAVAKPYLRPAGSSLDGGGVAAVFFLYVWTTFYAVTWNGTPWVVNAEVFPGAVRQVSQCLAATSVRFLPFAPFPPIPRRD